MWLIGVCLCVRCSDELQSPRAEFARDINYQQYNYWWENGKKKENVKILWHSVHIPYLHSTWANGSKSRMSELHGREGERSRKKNQKGFEIFDLWNENKMYAKVYIRYISATASIYSLTARNECEYRILYVTFETHKCCVDVIERARIHRETPFSIRCLSILISNTINFKNTEFSE